MDATWFLIYIFGMDSRPVSEPDRLSPVFYILIVVGVLAILAFSQKSKI